MDLNIYMDNTKEFQVLLQTKVKVMARLALDKNLQLCLAYKHYEINQVNFIDFRNLVLMFNIWTLMWIILSRFLFFFYKPQQEDNYIIFFLGQPNLKTFPPTQGGSILCSSSSSIVQKQQPWGTSQTHSPQQWVRRTWEKRLQMTIFKDIDAFLKLIGLSQKYLQYILLLVTGTNDCHFLFPDN